MTIISDINTLITIIHDKYNTYNDNNNDINVLYRKIILLQPNLKRIDVNNEYFNTHLQSLFCTLTIL